MRISETERQSPRGCAGIFPTRNDTSARLTFGWHRPYFTTTIRLVSTKLPPLQPAEVDAGGEAGGVADRHCSRLRLEAAKRPHFTTTLRFVSMKPPVSG